MSNVPYYELKIDGTPASPDVIKSVEEISIEQEIDLPTMFIIKLVTQNHSDTNDWNYIGLEDFKLGSEIDIKFGEEDGDSHIIGEVTAIEPSFNMKVSTVEIRGFDLLHRLKFGKKRRTFQEIKDSDLVSTICNDHGLSAKAESTSITHPYLIQDNLSDYEFLKRRASLLGFEVNVFGKDLIFRPSDETSSPVAELEFKVNLLEADLSLKTRYLGNKVVYGGWDYTKKEFISGESGNGSEVSKMEAQETGADMLNSAFGESENFNPWENAIDPGHAKELAASTFKKLSNEFVTGECKAVGMPEVRSGNNIKIKGIDRFEGTYYVTYVNQVIDKNGYRTDFKVRRVGL